MADDDCPLCLEPLPPFWDLEKGGKTMFCCGKSLCRECDDKRLEVVKNALANGTYGKAEEQIGGHCPLCRTKFVLRGSSGKYLRQKLNDGSLQLNLYRILALDYLEGEEGVEKNAAKGKEILMLGAEKGDPSCQFTLGALYRDGEYGLQKSPSEAKRWLRAAAEQGHAIAERYLAQIFRDEGNSAEFLRLLRSSASKGYGDACYVLGQCHWRGDFVPQRSAEEAIRVLTPAAERGHAKSMCMLGLAMCVPDRDLAPRNNPNFPKGMHWLRRGTKARGKDDISRLGLIEEDASGSCFMCKKKAPPQKAFLRCSRCCAAWYCSKDCQVQHWNAEEGGHKQYCTKWRPQK